MGFVVKRCDCDCGNQDGACSCSNYVLKCRSRGGLLSLIGFPEYSLFSSPPKKYRRKQNSGSASVDVYSSGDCSGTSSRSINCNYGGFCQYDRITGAFTTGGSTVCDGATASTGCGDVTADCTRTVTTTRLAQAASPTSNCCLSGGEFLKPASDSLRVVLSDEDFESDAILRLQLATAWGPWSTVPVATCCSYWERRIAGYSWAYTESQFRIEVTGEPSTVKTVKVPVYRRFGPSGPYVLYVTDEFTIDIGLDGTGFHEGDVDITRGFSTCVGNPNPTP